jgi:hypothetical protein
MTYPIEKGVPIPDFYWQRYKQYVTRSKPKRKIKYPFALMAIGDSFPLAKNTDNRQATHFRLLANAYSFKLGFRFVVLRDATHHFRCWRIS